MSKPKTVARFIFRIFWIPVFPILAFGFWLASDGTYVDALKETWKL